jgi:PAS domain S-box-containing protein
MATSPDYLRLASNAARALSDTALDNLCDAVLVVDGRHKHLPIVLANAAARSSLGRPSESLLEASLFQVLSPASIPAAEATIAGAAEANRPTSFLLSWRFQDGEQATVTEVRPLPDTQRLVMLTLLQSHRRTDLAQVIDHLPRELLILDRDLKVTYANGTAERSRSSIPGGLIGRSGPDLHPLSSLPHEAFNDVLTGKRVREDALAVTDPRGPTQWYEIELQPLKQDEVVTGMVALCGEVSEPRLRRRAQDSSERRLLALTEHARDIISIADREGRVQYVSGGVRNSLGYTSEERRSNYFFEHIHPDEYEDVRRKYQQLVDGEIEGFSKEFRIRHKDGSFRWLESSYSSALDNPLIGGIVINSRDITERKHAEFRLSQREEVFRLAADAVDGVIFEWDIPRGIVHRSRGVEEVIGVAPEDLESSITAWQERVHPRDFAQARRVTTLALMNGRGWTTTYRIRDARGRYKSILERALIQRTPAGDPVRAIGCCVDVSEIRRLTDILADTQRAAKIGGWEYNFGRTELTWTDEMFHIFDTTAQEFAVSWESMLKQCLPESAQLLRGAISRIESGSWQLDLEIEINTLKNKRLWVRIIGHVEMLDGRPFRAYGSLQNIQAQKVAQIAVESSTSWLKLSMNMAHMHAWRWDRTRDIFEFNTALEGKHIHLPSVYPGMQAMLAKVHPKDQAAVKRAIDLAFAQRREVREEFRLQGTDGRYRSYATIARPMFDAADVPRGLVGVIQDITGRRENERRLRQSDELLRTTTANTADTLFLVDSALKIKFINRAVKGLSIEQIIGQDIDVLLPESARATVVDRLRRMLSSGETLSYEFESLEQGQVRYFENHAIVVREDGIGTGISISMRDITERRHLEQEILDVSARERQSIGRDLHDGLGQELTGIALMLRGLTKRIEQRCPDVVENVDEVVSLVNQSIETARGLARGILPVRTETGGIAMALRALQMRSRDLYGLDVTFKSDVAQEFSLDEIDASHLYRITQEALTNAARHGRASHVAVELRAEPQGFALSITDDGTGFKEPPATSAGMGLKIMRYRAGIIGAQFEIEANEPHGTTVRVSSERPVPGITIGSSHTRR